MTDTRDSDIARLLRRVQRLELAARRNATGWLMGDYLTAIRGSGLVFHESRKYLPGEPARHIDWNVTARLGEPYVKVHLEERHRDVVIALDVSPSMHGGFSDRTKLETAVELAATLAVSAVDAGDRVGHLVFADRTLDESRPRGGRPQLFRVLRSLLEGCQPWDRPVRVSDLRVVIHALERHRRGRFVVFLISDFIDHDIPEDLKYVQAHHDMSFLHVYDPFELPESDVDRPPVVLRAFSPEGNPGPPRSLAPGEAGGLGEMQEFLRRQAARHRIAVESVSTTEPVDSALARFFHRKRRQLVGAP